MAQFFSGGIETMGAKTPPRPGVGINVFGGLGTGRVSPAAQRAMQRDMQRVMRSRQESSISRQLPVRVRNLITKTIAATVTKELMDARKDLEAIPVTGHLLPQVGQVGYTKRWAIYEWQCAPPRSPSHRFGYNSWPSDTGNVCFGFIGATNPMSAAPDLDWKFFSERDDRINFKSVTNMEGHEKTGTPGEDIWAEPTVIPMPEVLPKPDLVTALDPFKQKPGRWTETVSIPIRLLGLADFIAEQTEPFSEARSRTDEQHEARPAPETEVLTQVETGDVKITVRPTRLPKLQRDHKVTMSIAAGSLLGVLLNLATESLDVWNILYWSLPNIVRKKGLEQRRHGTRISQLERIETVINNIGFISIDKMMEGLIKNEIEDRFIGSLSGAAARSTAKQAKRGFTGFSGIARTTLKFSIDDDGNIRN